MKRLPSKTQRTKGFRAKHALQICLLLGVCFWLVYQVKHSHDKKKEFDDEKKVGSKVSVDKEETLKLGRKDLPREEPEKKKIIPEEEEEEEVEDDKHEEERENPSEEEEEESREEDPGNGDDELDENSREKTDPEEIGESDEDRAVENEVSSEDQVEENSSESDRSDDHEAREEHYRGDDASSEVAHAEEEPREASSLNGTKTSDKDLLEVKRLNEELPIVVTESRNSSAVEESDSSLLKNEGVDSTNMTVGESVIKEQPLSAEETNSADTGTEYTDESSKKDLGDEKEEDPSEKEGERSESGTHEERIEQDPIDPTDTKEVMVGQEMNEALTDLDTLPDLKSHGDETEEEVAAE